MFRLAGLLVFSSVLSAAGVGGQNVLTVRVWDYAEIPRPVLISAQKEIAYLFDKAGVQVEWLECDPKQRRGPGCTVPSANDIILRIHQRSALPSSFGAETLGRAIGDSYTDVFDTEVSRAALKQRVPRHQVYAMTMAHELGHLLLGPNSHTGTGIMRARWAPADFQAASVRCLLFAPRQCQAIRAAVASRGTASTAP